MNEKNSKWGINLNAVKCPKCCTEQPYIRLPKSRREILWGGYTCANCGCKMDKFGKELKSQKTK
jgi:hypothetical protein